MRNKLVIFSLIMATSFLSQAQLYMGAKVGLNFANVSATFVNTEFTQKIGIGGGGTLKFNFSNTFGLQSDLLYSQMGAQSKKVVLVDDPTIGKTTTTTEVLYDLSYIQVPLFVNIEIPIKSEKLIPYRYTENLVGIHLYGGGYFGYGIANNISTSVKDYLVDLDGNKTTTVIPKVSGKNTKFNAIDFGLAFGTGISFNLSKVGKLTVDGRYLLGLGNFNSSRAFVDGVKYPVMKNSAIQAQLGYIHRISKPKRWH